MGARQSAEDNATGRHQLTHRPIVIRWSDGLLGWHDPVLPSERATRERRVAFEPAHGTSAAPEVADFAYDGRLESVTIRTTSADLGQIMREIAATSDRMWESHGKSRTTPGTLASELVIDARYDDRCR